MTDTRPPRVVVRFAAGQSLCPELLAARERVDAAVDEACEALGLPTLATRLVQDATLAPRDLWMTLQSPDDVGRGHLWSGLPAGAIVARSSPLHVAARFGVSAEPWPDPDDARGAAALIRGAVREAVHPELAALSLDPVDAATIAIGAWMRRVAEHTVDAEVAARLLAALPAVDAAALLGACGIDVVVEILVALVAEGVPLHALAAMAPMLSHDDRVAWVRPGSVTAAFPGRLLIAAPRPDDAVERRLVIARAVAVPAALRRRAGAAPLQAWVVDEQSGWMPPDDGGSDSVAFDALLAERAAAAATVSQAIIVTSSARRAEIARRMRRSQAGTMVVAVHELPRGVRVQRRARIVLPTPPPDHDAARSRP